MQDKKFATPDKQEIFEYTLIDLDKSIVDLGIKLAEEAMKTTNADYKFKCVDAIVKLRESIPPIYGKR